MGWQRSLLLIFVCVFASASSWGADFYRINAGAQAQITEFSVCRNVDNNRAQAIFVPTKVTAEWTAFRTKPPSSVTVGYCFYDRNCTMENKNGICEKTFTCPIGTINRMKMVCHLEVAGDYSSRLESNSWNTAEVRGASDNGYACKVGTASYASETTHSMSSNSALGKTSVTYSCQDSDGNGGDCSIYMRVECKQ